MDTKLGYFDSGCDVAFRRNALYVDNDSKAINVPEERFVRGPGTRRFAETQEKYSCWRVTNKAFRWNAASRITYPESVISQFK